MKTTEHWIKKIEPHCSQCGRPIRVNEEIEVRNRPHHTDYYCPDCVSKWG